MHQLLIRLPDPNFFLGSVTHHIIIILRGHLSRWIGRIGLVWRGQDGKVYVMFTLKVILGVRIHHSIIVFIEVRRVSLFFFLRVEQTILTIMCSKWLLGPLNCHSRAN